MAQDRLAAAAEAAEGLHRAVDRQRLFRHGDERGESAAGEFLAVAAMADGRGGLLHRRPIAHRAAQAAALDVHSHLPSAQYCPFGSRPKACWPYIVPTASQFRLTWRATALTSRQARCTGLSRSRPCPPVEAFSASTACTASFVT